MGMSKREEKKINRQTANANKQKNLAKAPSPGGRKSVPLSQLEAPKTSDSDFFRWSVSQIDHEYAGSWNWDLKPKETSDLLKLLEECGRKTWSEIRSETTSSKSRTRRRHHEQCITDVCREAQRRLEELQIDVEELFRLRHGNKRRIWGYVQGSVFYILWDDRKHKVYPTEN